MASAKQKVAYAKPYVERALSDQEVRDHIRRAFFAAREYREPIDQSSEATSKISNPIPRCRVSLVEKCRDGAIKMPTPRNPPASPIKTGTLGRGADPLAHESSTI